MPASDIVIKGAREHNLRDVNLVLPRNQLICFTGVSGSGKSSLAFDTLYAEGQRRYIESLSSFARQFLGQMPKPDVDFISGLRPSISISQKSSGANPRSTVGTVTEIADYLRVLFARVGQGFCPKCQRPIAAQSREQILAGILTLPAESRFAILAPVVRGQKGEHRDLFSDLLKQGFTRARVDGQIMSLADDVRLDRKVRHDIEVVVDRLTAQSSTRARLAEAVELALKIGQGTLIVALERAAPRPTSDAPAEPAAASRTRKPGQDDDIIFSVDYACAACRISFEPPTPQLFSFNSPQGMCPHCDGLGELFTFDAGLLVPDPKLSFKQGGVTLVGAWKEMGRWRRHIYQGVADTMERVRGLPPGTLLDTPFGDLDRASQDVWLWGTGDQHITFTWRGGESPMMYGGRFEGIIPDLQGRYRTSRSIPQQRLLEKFMRTMPCGVCRGRRLNELACSVRIHSAHPRFAANGPLSLPAVGQLPISQAVEFFAELQLNPTQQIIATEVLKEIRGRLGFLLNVGLDYLTLDRAAPTLSGGETQRIRLAGQIGSGLVGVLYILDEPSIGLHPRDNARLIDTLGRLRDIGNTVIVVEHDEDTMLAADQIIDFGPGPGVRGGEVVVSGTVDDVCREPRSVTGQFLSGAATIDVPTRNRLHEPTKQPAAESSAAAAATAPPRRGRKASAKPVASESPAVPADQRPSLRVLGAAHNNLRNIDVEIPLGAFVCVTGVSGSGKSSLVNDILVEALRRDLNGGEGTPGRHREIRGLEHLDKLIAIDQSPIGRTPRSNPGTYIKVFDEIRNLFVRLPEAKRRGYKPGRFSFNVQGGRCEACEGNGANRLEMDFLADIWVTCPVCEGHRYTRETLQVKYKQKSIAEILEMDVQQLLELFENVPAVRHKLQTLHDVGLDYLKLGQPSPTLSGGEAQRIKLARELVKKSTGRTLYLLDEPTTGLHFADIKLLLKVLHDFADAGNTVLVVEHNLDVVKTADWIIDLGPEGGAAGGEIVVCGTPEQVRQCPRSHTGRALTEFLQRGQHALGASGRTGRRSGAAGATNGARSRAEQAAARARLDREFKSLIVRGAQQHNLKAVDVDIARDKMTVFCGPSGSGKSSLAMDTIYAEGQRRYVESLSSYARQFVAQMQKPRVEQIQGLSPAIAIEQKNLGHTPRSTVGTVTEIYDYFRVLMARLGQLHCPQCEIPVGTQTVDEIVDKLLAEPAGTRMYLLAPVEVAVGEEFASIWEELRGAGFARVRIDGQTHELSQPPELSRRRRHEVEVVVDRLVIKPDARSRINDSVETALAFGKGVLKVAVADDSLPERDWETRVHSQHLACGQCGRSFQPLSPHSFSFNNSLGWCPSCEGLGVQIGANPAALLRDPKLTLRDGALALWPNLQHQAAAAMLAALAETTRMPLDVPFDQLAARHRRVLLYGAGEQWFTATAAIPPLGKAPLSFRFQFKGLYPALEEASRLSPTLRARLEEFVAEVDCSVCDGSRLRDDASAAQFRGRTIADYVRLPLGELLPTIKAWKLDVRERRIAGEITREITARVQFLNDVGLEYLSLGRGAATLSNGEAQRIRLASQLGSGLCGVLYVLDEPTIGLHPRDNTRLLRALHKLRDLGNTLVIVEHDREVIEGSDYLCDFGPGAGRLGGEIVGRGTLAQLGRQRGSVTGPYLTGKKSIPVPTNRRPVSPRGERPGGLAWLDVLNARHHNLRGIDVSIPLGTLTAVTGPSGSGKSSLIEDVLFASLARTLHRAAVTPGAHDGIRGLNQINKVIRVDQQPLGNSPTSNPATYTGAFELIRLLFAQLPDAKVRGFSARRFSFNVPGGRCEACEGNGQRKIEMHFLPDVWVECETCRGQRYNPETLAVRFHGHSISDVLDMTCGDAVRLFENIPKIRRVLQTLCDVGLDYLTLGQSAPTLSGGEAQRVKLAAELSRPDTGRTLYLLDEPTTGLHFDDIAKLLTVMHRLVDLGNTVVVIEHNLDVIKQADWIIDMGPEAGAAGGSVVFAGTPEGLAASLQTSLSNGARKKTTRKPAAATSSAALLPAVVSHTGIALAPVLAAGPHEVRPAYDPQAAQPAVAKELDIAEVGSEIQMPWEADGRRWHTQDRVDRRGEPCRWDGRILAEVVDRIQESGKFSETNWNARSVVEIAHEKKSLGWFFHAITGESWLLKLKFRVGRGTFRREQLIEQLNLKTLNQLNDIPVYGNEPRVAVRSVQGRWQEVEVRAHSWEEIDSSEFWQFLDRAIAGFGEETTQREQNVDDHSPWKKLGQKWHLLRKGFPPGKPIQWDAEILEELLHLVEQAAPGCQFLWNNQTVVRVYLSGGREPWAGIVTKKPEALTLVLPGPKGAIPFGRFAHLGCDRELDAAAPDRDRIKLRFRKLADLQHRDLLPFLREHVQVVLAPALNR